MPLISLNGALVTEMFVSALAPITSVLWQTGTIKTAEAMSASILACVLTILIPLTAPLSLRIIISTIANLVLHGSLTVAYENIRAAGVATGEGLASGDQDSKESDNKHSFINTAVSRVEALFSDGSRRRSPATTAAATQVQAPAPARSG